MITNRDIRFRCWDTKTKRFIREVPAIEAWLDNDEWDDPEEHYDAMSFYPSNPIRSFDGRLAYDEYTGTKDKDDNEVWENDVVEVAGVKHLVEWAPGGFCVGDGYLVSLSPTEVKKLGNRWEKPELMSV